MALKGTTVIELTNVKTGEKERYVEQNMLTNALDELFKPIPGMRMPMDGITTDSSGSRTYSAQINEPAFYSLLGGIVLWDTPITEDASIITQPHGVKMVGCAAYNSTNTTTSPCRGSYNATESYFTNSSVETSMKFVYDFATNQANGIIRSISLCGYSGGRNGFGGNEDCNDFSGSFGRFGSSPLSYINTPYKPYYNNSSRAIYLDPDEDVLYEIASLTTTTLRIYKLRANLKSRSLFKNVFASKEILETISITLPTTLSGTNTWVKSFDTESNTLYIVVSPSASSVSSSGAFYTIAVNMESYETTVYTMTNPLSSNLNVRYEYLTCCGGYLYYIYEDQSYVRKVSMADSTYTSIRVPSPTYYTSYIYPCTMNGMVYFYGGYKDSNNNYNGVLCCLDPATNKAVCTGYSGNIGTLNSIYIKGHPLYWLSTDSSSSNNTTYYYSRLYMVHNYIATINNLSREIEKTSDKTMKITYTIQEA